MGKILFGNLPMCFFSSLQGVIGGFSCVFLSTWCFAASPSDSVLQDNLLPETNLIYVSDYFSFVGQDDQGHVALALDNNRGRDGESWQAEHFVVVRSAAVRFTPRWVATERQAKSELDLFVSRFLRHVL